MTQRYTVKGKIGQGGLGDVYLANDTQLDRDVALKRVRPPETGSAEALHQDLIREARTLSSLQHPNIVTIYDVGTDEQGPFVVMEFLKGETLDQVIDRGALTVEDFQEVVVQSLEGMIAAQALGLVHRDLKPGNLMVIWLASGKFQIKILDFGLAKFSLTATRQTEDQEDGIMGTIYFMAPEQFERLPLDARTDMYSLGCIFYQILTTKAPFDGQTGPEVMVSHLQHHVVHLVEARPDLPIWMADWVMWLISREMDDRPPDARTALDFFRAQTSGIKNPTPVPVTPVAPVVRIVGRGSGPGAVTTVIRSGNSTQRLPAGGGSGTQRLQGTSATARSSRASAKKIAHHKKSNAGLWIVLGVVAAAAAAAVWYLSRDPSKPGAEGESSALSALLNSDAAPPDTPETWSTLIAAVKAGRDSAPKALAVLKKMSGPRLAKAIAAELAAAGGPGRLLLMEAVGDHPSAEGKAQLLKIASAESGEVQGTALSSLGKAAALSDVEPMLRILPKITAPANRTLLLKAAGAALASDPTAPDRAQPLISVLSGSGLDHNARQELLRLLAGIGDPAGAATLNAEIASPGERREFALSLLPDWVAPQATTAAAILAAAQAPEDRDALIAAYCLLTPRIAGWDGGDFTIAMKDAQRLLESGKNRDAFAAALGSNASPEAADYAKELGTTASWAGHARDAAKSISALQEKATTLAAEGPTTLEAEKAVIHAVDKDLYYSATSRYLTNWKDPKSALSWDIIVPEAGSLNIQALLSGSAAGTRSFRIRLADDMVETVVKPTPSNEEFVPLEAGKFNITKAGTWRLFLEPARMEPGQPLMNLRQLTLTFSK